MAEQTPAPQIRIPYGPHTSLPTKFRLLPTLSAQTLPDSCYRGGNKAALLSFHAVPQPHTSSKAASAATPLPTNRPPAADVADAALLCLLSSSTQHVQQKQRRGGIRRRRAPLRNDMPLLCSGSPAGWRGAGTITASNGRRWRGARPGADDKHAARHWNGATQLPGTCPDGWKSHTRDSDRSESTQTRHSLPLRGDIERTRALSTMKNTRISRYERQM